MLWPKFLLVLAVYYLVTIAYSLALKRQMILDVVTLACLYGLRLIAGSAAVDVKLSSWLVAFSIFLFTSLALVKRCAELMDRKKVDLADAAGRDYRTADLPLLELLAAASGFTAVLVFSLYMKSVDVALLYSDPSRLWLIPIILIYWISRVVTDPPRRDARRPCGLCGNGQGQPRLRGGVSGGCRREHLIPAARRDDRYTRGVGGATEQARAVGITRLRLWRPLAPDPSAGLDQAEPPAEDSSG